MTLHKYQVTEPQDQILLDENLLTMGTMDNVLQKQSSSAAVIFTLCTLSWLISLSSDNYHVNPEPQLVTTRKPGNDEASLSGLTLRLPVFREAAGILQTAPHTQHSQDGGIY